MVGRAHKEFACNEHKLTYNTICQRQIVKHQGKPQRVLQISLSCWVAESLVSGLQPPLILPNELFMYGSRPTFVGCNVRRVNCLTHFVYWHFRYFLVSLLSYSLVCCLSLLIAMQSIHKIFIATYSISVNSFTSGLKVTFNGQHLITRCMTLTKLSKIKIEEKIANIRFAYTICKFNSHDFKLCKLNKVIWMASRQSAGQ